jgi:glutaredoxin 3
MINVYGKPDCTWCTAAKTLLDLKNIPYNYYSVGEDVGIDYIIENFSGVRTVPIIQVNGTHIGGYDDLVKYLEDTSGGHADNI